MSVIDLTDEPESEGPVTAEEARTRFRKLAWEQPDFNFSILEALMSHLGIPEDKQREIIMDGAVKWQKA